MPSFGTPTDLSPSPLAAVERLLRARGHRTPIGLHQEKTAFPPCAEPRVWERAEFGIAPHEPAPPAGVPALRERLAAVAGARRGTAVDPDRILLTAGATHAVAVVLHAILRPGDDVLILSPQWLSATGLVHAAGGVPREVPVFLELSDPATAPGFGLVPAVEAAVGPRTRAIYLNNPNNPTGHRLDAAQLAALVDLAERHDLWLIADNAYENYDFSADGFRDTATVDGADARTFAVHSCSKTYVIPGARVGYLISPPGCAETLVKRSPHTLRSVSTVAQFAAFEALSTSPGELAARRRLAADAYRLAAEALEIPHTAVAGGLSTFLDLRAYGDGEEFVRRCAEQGVGLVPGRAFGEHCAAWARLCFTAAPPQTVLEAVHRINKVYGKGAS
ncbi:pyridoxal phosphate-dependent aminotransferase [Streptomyces caeni]|uniref:Aminotransferase n=1 Tax=Streptomyces caeni TaxID=2307231 RepID=A0ABW4IX27_9ACTN